MTLPKKTYLAVAIVTAVLLLDQLIKIWVKTSFVPDQPVPVLGDWFRLLYVENQGMAFGTTLGSGWISKLVLSLFRLVAICGIVYYIRKQLITGVKTELLVALCFILAGATGNLIDSACYDFIFGFDPQNRFNWVVENGNYVFDATGHPKVRQHGFLFGNVVDMFQFNLFWPKWLPYIGGQSVFSAIWNLADGAISVGVMMLLFRQKTYFPKKNGKATQTLEEEQA